jgi:hypothetical protein
MAEIDTDQGTANVPIPEAIAYLSNQADWTSNRIELMWGDHSALLQVRDATTLDWVVSGVADVFGGFLTMPDLHIWDRALDAIIAVRGALAATDPAAAGAALKEANSAYQGARRTYLTYKEGHLEGADTTITVLRDVIVVDAAVGEVGVAVMTGGASMLTQVGAAGGMGAETGLLKNWGEQAAEGKSFNWTELAEQTVAGFASGFLSAMVSGPLKEMLQESCSGYVTEELMSEADLEEIRVALGADRIERSFLQSSLKKFLIEQGTDQAGKWLAGKPIEVVAEQMKRSASEGKPPPDETSSVDTAAKVAAPAIAQAFKVALNVLE